MAECSIEGCDRAIQIPSRGWCRKHYLRWWKTGDPTTVRPQPPQKGRKHHDAGEHRYTRLSAPCREWLGLRSPKGYGTYHRRSLHRWVWEQINGPIPAGKLVMHLCDNPPCYRYDHLRLGTIADNQADMKAKGRGDNGRRAFTADQVDEIRQRVAAEEKATHVARDMNLSESGVRDVAAGRTYKHLPMKEGL